MRTKQISSEMKRVGFGSTHGETEEIVFECCWDVYTRQIMGIKQTKAYDVIRQLNKELREKGFFTVEGKVSRRYFNERLYNDETTIKDNESQKKDA